MLVDYQMTQTKAHPIASSDCGVRELSVLMAGMQ